MTIEYADIHAHLDDSAFDGDREEVLGRSEDILIVNAGLDHETNLKTLKLAEHYENVKACLGLHPEFVVRSDLEGARRESKFIRERSKEIVGVSEIGLDYKFEEREKQKEAFYLFLGLAQELNLPVVVHSRRASGAVLDVLRKFDVKTVLHAFSGNMDEVRRALDAGYFLSIGPNVLYNSYRQRLTATVPIEQMLSETDSPVLGPVIDLRNEPSNVKIAVDNIVKIKGLDPRDVKRRILHNARLVFKLP